MYQKKKFSKKKYTIPKEYKKYNKNTGYYYRGIKIKGILYIDGFLDKYIGKVIYYIFYPSDSYIGGIGSIVWIVRKTIDGKYVIRKPKENIKWYDYIVLQGLSKNRREPFFDKEEFILPDGTCHLERIHINKNDVIVVMENSKKSSDNIKMHKKVSRKKSRKVTKKVSRKVSRKLSRKKSRKVTKKVSRKLSRKKSSKVSRKIYRKKSKRLLSRNSKKVSRRQSTKVSRKVSRKKIKKVSRKVSRKSGCKRSDHKKYFSRPGPPFPANQCCDKIKSGNDGIMYKSIRNSKGVCSWKKL
jgi:hypothetical protein